MHHPCVVCGALFNAPPSTKKTTCSAACSTEQRRRSHRGKGKTPATRAKLAKLGQTDNLKRGMPAAQKSPIAGPFETNYKAKSWEVIHLNTGAHYPVRNLRKFCRDHAALFAPDPWENAYKGLLQVQAWLMGKKSRAIRRWKQWTLATVAQ